MLNISISDIIQKLWASIANIDAFSREINITIKAGRDLKEYLMNVIEYLYSFTFTAERGITCNLNEKL